MSSYWATNILGALPPSSTYSLRDFHYGWSPWWLDYPWAVGGTFWALSKLLKELCWREFLGLVQIPERVMFDDHQWLDWMIILHPAIFSHAFLFIKPLFYSTNMHIPCDASIMARGTLWSPPPKLLWILMWFLFTLFSWSSTKYDNGWSIPQYVISMILSPLWLFNPHHLTSLNES